MTNRQLNIMQYCPFSNVILSYISYGRDNSHSRMSCLHAVCCALFGGMVVNVERWIPLEFKGLGVVWREIEPPLDKLEINLCFIKIH